MKKERVTNFVLAIAFAVCCRSAGVASYRLSSEGMRMLERLDSTIEVSGHYVNEKEQRIALLKKQKTANNTDGQYYANEQLYEEYKVYDSDSAMTYVNANIALAQREGKTDWLTDWKIKRSFVLSVTGLLAEAFDELRYLDVDAMSDGQRMEYFAQMMYLYSHQGQYQGMDMNTQRNYYYQMENASIDSLMKYISNDHPLYLWYRGWQLRAGGKDTDGLMLKLEETVDKAAGDTRLDAMNAYLLAILYNDRNDTENYVKYLVLSALADVRTSNKDIASLEELGKFLYKQGDIDRAFNYLNYCFNAAQQYRNRVRIMGISATLNAIREYYQQRNAEQEHTLHRYLWTVSILAALLATALIYIFRQMRRLKASRRKLTTANESLHLNVDKLNDTQARLQEANAELTGKGEELNRMNAELKEANYLKEEYIGYVFFLCSGYINKLDEYRKMVNRKLKVGQVTELRQLTDSPTMAQTELKEFYRSFDTLFLNIYPNFVSDFNSLLREEEQIQLHDDELLNTTLRIYALVRLGINDSVKIAEFLHCSPQTVYNNRQKTRNKAIVPKEKFAETVMSLGKMDA